MFVPISIDDYITKNEKSNPGYNMVNLRKALSKYVKAKKNGRKCDNCGNLIWAAGSAIADWNACFSCITGESDNSNDYEIDSVCF
jgi:hypothetical protein